MSREVPIRDVREEAVRVLGMADERGLHVRAIGGLGVFLSSPSARRPPLARDYKDLDLAGPGSERHLITETLIDAGYRADEQFNALHGSHQLFFQDPSSERAVDVIIDRLEMCHSLDLRKSFGGTGPALPVTDLLLSKLQIVDLTKKDLLDA